MYCMSPAQENFEFFVHPRWLSRAFWANLQLIVNSYLNITGYIIAV